jgi:hypothetical protein
MAIRPFPFDLMRTALLICALLSLAAGALLMGQQGSVEGATHIFVIASLVLVLGIILLVLLFAD